jgi:oxygen-independent coproporphyrinogen-3 oxidase
MGRAILKNPGNSAKNVCFDQELISRYGGRGPRYTSYPTALQFDESLTVEKYKRAVSLSNDSERPLSLYVHIPFCESLCYYCACNKIVTRNAERVEKYLGHLYREIDLQGALFNNDRVVEQLHFGGGTPTYLNVEQLCDLMTHIAGSFKLDHSDNREFSIEVDPRTVNATTLKVLTDLGFNRLSLGIQDFEPEVQRAINRTQDKADVQALVDQARSVGFRSVSFDLIYGLPLQTVKSFDRTIDQVIAMQPDRLAVYNYAHLPERFKGQRMIREEDIPLAETKLQILDHTISKLSEAGYIYIGMDHFALPEDELVRAQRNNTLQRNFQGYSTHRDCDLIALGVSAIGHIGNTYVQNAATTMEYEALLEVGKLPVKRGIEVDADDQLRAQVIQELMCHDQLVFSDFSKSNNIDFHDYFAPELARLGPLADDGLVLIGPEGIQITAKGRLLLRSIAMAFDRYIAEDSNDGRFSKAI